MENKKNNTLDVDIHDLAFGGDGVARVEGKACFVPFTMPGDTCRIQVRQNRKHFMRGRISEVLQPAPDRIKPLCPVFGKCGGCQYQHMTYEAECRFKENQVRQTMIRLGGLDHSPMRPLVASPKPYGYRNRIQIHVEGNRIGFRGGDGQTLVPIRQCPIASEQINAQLQQLTPSQLLGQRKLALSDDGTASAGFSQVNRWMNELLKSEVARALEGRSGKLVELYAGGGYFTEALAEQFASITAVEWDSRLVERSREVCPEHVEWIHTSVEEAVSAIHWKSERPEELTLLVDPPREGIAANALTAIKSSGAGRLVYLSCNPSTQARDLKQLTPEWRVTELTPIDLFPRTAHIENLAVCERVV